MVDGGKLAEAIWPAINIEMMISQAWSVCFEGEFRQDYYRPIIHVVFFSAVSADRCAVDELRKQVADAFGIDQETVEVRIKKMVQAGLLARVEGLKDGREALIAPTQQLIAAYTKYSGHLVDLLKEFAKQADSCDRPPRDHKAVPSLYFDIRDHLDKPKVNVGRFEGEGGSKAKGRR
jgi:hypothetical protein